MSHDGRFAPSPTGPLHLGSLRTALAAWLFARSAGARFLLRIEDLDPERCRPELERAQIADLTALGLDWDGPPVRQSERVVLYERAIAQLKEAGLLYPCFCTRAEIRQATLAPHGPYEAGPDRRELGLPERAYPGTCRKLSPQERAVRIRAGKPFALRVKAGGELVEFEDRLLGRRRGRVDDFVVRRADGVHSYQLAVVVDDAEQRVGEVVRGADLASSTPRQILLARLLELPVPAYAHVPLVLGPDGARLAKRHGAATRAERREPAAATLAWLAHSLGLARQATAVVSPQELLDQFDPACIPPDPVVIADSQPCTLLRGATLEDGAGTP